MNINNLEVGKVYKDYKVLCATLECTPKSGSSKPAQLKEMERYFSYTRNGNSYVIDEIYEKPKPKLGKGNTIFRDITKLLIMDMLAEKEGELSIGKTKLISRLGIANDNYNGCRKIIPKLSKYLDVNIQTIYDFYDINDSNFKNIIEGSLNALVDERRIVYHLVTKVKELNSFTYRIATEDELQTILNVEGNVLTKMEYRSISEVRVSKDWNIFKNKVKDILHAMTKIDYYFDAYNILIHEERISKGRDELLELILEKSKRADFRQELNELIMNSIDRNAKRRHEDLGKTKKESKKINRAKNDYVGEFRVLNNVVINLDKDNIVNEVNKVEIKDSVGNSRKTPTEIDSEVKEYVEQQLEGLFE